MNVLPPGRIRHRDHGHQGSGVDYRRRNWGGNRHQANWQRAAKVLGGRRSPILDPVPPGAVAATPGDSELLPQLHEVPEAQRASFLTNIHGTKYNSS
jgi:hypothetical protein